MQYTTLTTAHYKTCNTVHCHLVSLSREVTLYPHNGKNILHEFPSLRKVKKKASPQKEFKPCLIARNAADCSGYLERREKVLVNGTVNDSTF